MSSSTLHDTSSRPLPGVSLISGFALGARALCHLAFSVVLPGGSFCSLSTVGCDCRLGEGFLHLGRPASASSAVLPPDIKRMNLSRATAQHHSHLYTTHAHLPRSPHPHSYLPLHPATPYSVRHTPRSTPAAPSAHIPTSSLATYIILNHPTTGVAQTSPIRKIFYHHLRPEVLQ